MKKTIVVEVEGGCLQGVFSNFIKSSDVNVILIDWDNIKAGDIITQEEKDALDSCSEVLF